MRNGCVAGIDRLFAYGTLVLPEVFLGVTGEVLAGIPARLEGYARYRIRHQTFPGIIETPADSTDGILYSGITDWHWRRLDEFENDHYERRMVRVQPAHGSELDACTYVVAAPFRSALSDEPWDSEDFRRHHLARYLRHIRSV